METNTIQPKAPLHPMIWVATIAVTAASLVGIASMTGLISPRAAEASVAQAAPVTDAVKTPVPTATVETKPVAKVEKRTVVRHEEPVQVAQYSGGSSYGGIPVNHGTRADGSQSGGYPAQTQSAPPARVYSSAPRCNDCGTVESVRTVTKEGDGSGVGAVAGGVVGGALGNGVGQGNGRTLATIAGAVGGAVLGNKLEKDHKKVTVYESTIRMEDGSRRTVTNESRPAWQQGDAVQVDRGTVVLR